MQWAFDCCLSHSLLLARIGPNCPIIIIIIAQSNYISPTAGMIHQTFLPRAYNQISQIQNYVKIYRLKNPVNGHQSHNNHLIPMLNILHYSLVRYHILYFMNFQTNKCTILLSARNLPTTHTHQIVVALSNHASTDKLFFLQLKNFCNNSILVARKVVKKMHVNISNRKL